MLDAFSPGRAARYRVRVVIDEIGREHLLHELNTASAPQLVAVHADGLSVLVERRDDAQGCVAGMRNCTPVSSSETAQSRREASSSRAAPEEPTGRG